MTVNNFRNWFVFFLIFAASILATKGSAQGASEPSYLPIKITVKGALDGTGPASQANIVATVDTAVVWPMSDAMGTFNNAGELDFPAQVLAVETGRETALTISTRFANATRFTLTTPPGYTMLINGLERKSKTVNGAGVFKIRVLPSLDAAVAPAGTATEFAPGQMKWGVSLGAELNGSSLGWLWIINAGLSDAQFFTNPNQLYFEKDSDELTWEKQDPVSGAPYSNSVYRQLRANEAFIDVITPYTKPAANVDPVVGAVLELRFYHPSHMTSSGTIRTPLADRHPFVIYRLIDESTNVTKRFVMEKQICATVPSPTRQVLRTERTTITRAGSYPTTSGSPACVWTATGWTLLGTSPLSETVSTWTYIGGGHREIMEIRDLTVSPPLISARVQTDYVSPQLGLPIQPAVTAVATERPLDDDSDGDTDIPPPEFHSATDLITNVKYYGDIDANGAPIKEKRYRFGFPQLTTDNSGAWSAVAYVDPANRTPAIPKDDRDKWLGVVATTYSPWLNKAAPSLATNQEPAAAIGMIITRYDYAEDRFEYPSRPTLIETYRDSISASTLISKRVTTYSGIGHNGRDAIEAITNDFSGSGSSLQSSRIYYREDDLSPFFRNQVNTEVSATGTKTAYIRQKGKITISQPDVPVSFNPGGSPAGSRIGVLVGAETASPETEATAITNYEGHSLKPMYLLPGRSTLTFTYRDEFARVIRTESYIRGDFSGWVFVGWESLTYNTRNQVTSRTTHTGDLHEYYYEGEQLVREVDSSGVETTYEYDAAGRLKKSIRSPFAERPALVTEMFYDGADRVVRTSTYPLDNPSLASVSERKYDLAGRVIYERGSGAGPVKTYYKPEERKTTVVDALQATKTIETYADGQVYRTYGTAVLPEQRAYLFESDGRRRTDAIVLKPAPEGYAASQRVVSSWTDWLGRETKTERPAPPGIAGPVATTTTYSPTTGLPIKTTTPGAAPSLTTYDVVGAPVLTGLDADRSGTLDPASAKDRIAGTRSTITYAGDCWWAVTESFTYAKGGSNVETVLGRSWTRLTGFSNNLVAESRVWDTEGNLTRKTVVRNRASRTVTTTTWLPGIASPQVEVAVDGLPVSTTAPDGLVTTSLYDSLRRPIISRSPKSGSAGGFREMVTTYLVHNAEATGLVATTTDSENRTTRFEYDELFRPYATFNSDNKATLKAYNTRGQVTHIYGEGASPVRFVYDDLGQQVEQHTFRSTSPAFTAIESFPGVNASETDKVTWTHDEATGLLKQKTDPLGRFVAYTYDAAGRIQTREWARTVSINNQEVPLRTTVAYDPDTGDTLSTTYNDGVTAPVVTSYDRLGRPLTIADVTGTRTFVRDEVKSWRTNAELLSGFYGTGLTLSWLYDETTTSAAGVGQVKGRTRGFRLGTTVQPASLLEQTMAWSEVGRLRSVTSIRDTSSSQSFLYTYTPNSRLVESVSAPGTSFTMKREWDPVRDLLTKIETKSGARVFAQYAYTYTSLGQRSTATQAGDAFAADAADPAETTTNYTYNDRGELTSALTGVGTSATAPSALIPGRKFAFAYDLAGNRMKSTHQGDLSGPAAVSYVVGPGNQLKQRDNPSVSVSGTIANPEAVVGVDQGPAQRQGRYWQRDVAASETETAQSVPDDATGVEKSEYPRAARSVMSFASLAGAGPGGTDLTSFDVRWLTQSPRDEQLRYDRDGNLERDGAWRYAWDAENRLVRMETHDWLSDRTRYRIDFKYDYQGRRVSKRVQIKPVGATEYGMPEETRFLYDGWNLIAEFKVVSGQPIVQRSYTWGLDLVGSLTASGGVGGLLQISDHYDSASYFPGYDGNGNVAVLVRASDGLRAAAYEYGPSGEVLRSEGIYAKANPFRFSSKFTDDESGLVYYGHRYYDAKNGRFINRDPIEERGGLNLYDFCGNDGVNRWDYLGQSWFSQLFKKIKKVFKQINPLGYVIDAIDWQYSRIKKALDWVKEHPMVATVILSIAGGWWAAAYLAPALGITSAAGVGALAGGVGGFIGGSAGAAFAGGSMGDILKAGFVGGAIGAAAGGILGHLGTFQGFDKQMSFSTYLGKMGEATVVGGSASGLNAEFNGGTFLDGFRTSAPWSAGAFVVTAGLQTYLTERGEAMYPSGGSQTPSSYDKITTNGILGDPKAFQRLLDFKKIYMGYYNPSQGIINDVMQAAMQKLCLGVGDSLASGFGQILNQMASGPITAVGHSQGALTVRNSVFRGEMPSGSHLMFRSPAMSIVTAKMAQLLNGGSMQYVQPWFDAANIWSPSFNPVKWVSGVGDIPMGGAVHIGNYSRAW